jgi:hypothetical protein
MKDLFYFESENWLCLVAGYTEDGNTSNVSKMIKSLESNAKEFAALAGVDIHEVQTHYISQSQRYKNMRCFYAKASPKNVPKEAFTLGKDWTMHKWLSY